jgi:hypothetical protein
MKVRDSDKPCALRPPVPVESARLNPASIACALPERKIVNPDDLATWTLVRPKPKQDPAN